MFTSHEHFLSGLSVCLSVSRVTREFVPAPDVSARASAGRHAFPPSSRRFDPPRSDTRRGKFLNFRRGSIYGRSLFGSCFAGSESVCSAAEAEGRRLLSSYPRGVTTLRFPWKSLPRFERSSVARSLGRRVPPCREGRLLQGHLRGRPCFPSTSFLPLSALGLAWRCSRALRSILSIVPLGPSFLRP